MSFDWRAVLVLPADVEIIEISALDRHARSAIADTGEEYLIHRPGSRDSAKAIDADGARLLECFRTPRRIVDAVIAMSRTTGMPAEDLLNESFPLLQRMVGAGLLAVTGSQNAAALAPLLETGHRLGRWRIEACVRLIDDSEIYRARAGDRLAAIKRLRPLGVEHGLGPLVSREAEILARLPGSFTPALLDSDATAELPWLAIAWREGLRPDKLGPDSDMVAISLAIADAYASLHRQGILHGDVHPGNVLVDAQGEICLIDFALARLPGDAKLDRIFRGAVQGYWEPEFAAAMLRSEGEIPLTAAGEQYAVATLVDTLIAGDAAVQLPLVAAGHWEAIAGGDHRCFAERGRPAWPTLERVLRRATAREPARRYADMEEFAAALRQAAALPAAAIRPGSDALGGLLEEVLPGGALFEQGLEAPPRCSFNFGAAGIAFALYRIARARESGELLAAAELWQLRAEAAIESSTAFYDIGEFREQDLGGLSPYHSASGVWLTRSLLARAMGDYAGCDAAIRRFAATGGGTEASELDLTLGRSATLLGAAILYGARPAPVLRRLGDGLVESIWTALAVAPPIRDGGKHAYLGIAHGWAGYIYAALMWARTTATPPKPHVIERLRQLMEIGEGDGACLRVPLAAPDQGSARKSGAEHGWLVPWPGRACLPPAACRSDLAPWRVRRSSPGRGRAAGRGSIHRPGGRRESLLRACRPRLCGAGPLSRDLGSQMARTRACPVRALGRGTYCDRWPNSLYKGRVGLALIAAEVERPDLAAMPLFEDEGWLAASPPAPRGRPAAREGADAGPATKIAS